MITRPLDLASKLRPEPRSLDWLFFVNGGLIVLLFVLFGSRFVLSPGLGMDFRLPEAPGANAEPRATTHVITVESAGQILVGDGVRPIDQLADWLRTQAKTVRNPSLLVRASENVPTAIMMRIIGMAHAAGFEVTIAAEEPTKSGAGDRP